MFKRTSRWVWSLLAVPTAAFGYVFLAFVFHVLGLCAPQKSYGYEYTQYLTSCISIWFFAAWLILAMALGSASKTAWPVAFGMVFPLPLAVKIETAKDPTSHNLLGFEVVGLWLPAFFIAFGAARFGMTLWRNRQSPT